jgi:uncharacterized protein (TIGR02145 family)
MKFRILFIITILFLFNNSYSQEMIDIDGNIYKTAKIGVQHIRCGFTQDGLENTKISSDSFLIWTTSNLNVSKFRDGTNILEAKTNELWNYAIDNGIPAFCYLNNDSSNGKTYGKLYNYYAVISLKELAPKGWHISSDFEWSLVYKYYKVNITEANLYEDEKIFMSTKWESGYKWGKGTNLSGFNALPSSYRVAGGFISEPSGAYFWSDIPLDRKSGPFTSILGDQYMCDYGCGMTFKYGFSVRCVKDW